jgi:plastocyanin
MRHLLLIAMPTLILSAGVAQSATIEVTIEKMAFSPAEVEVKIGDTIEWVNKDAFVHTASVKGGWDVQLPVKTSGSIVVDKAGTLDYYCRFHPNMKGRITVAP